MHGADSGSMRSFSGDDHALSLARFGLPGSQSSPVSIWPSPQGSSGKY